MLIIQNALRLLVFLLKNLNNFFLHIMDVVICYSYIAIISFKISFNKMYQLYHPDQAWHQVWTMKLLGAAIDL